MALTQVKGLGSEGAKNLIVALGSAEKIFKTPAKELLGFFRMGPKTVAALKNFKDFSRVEKELDFIVKNKVKAISFTDDEYPYRLKELSNAPSVVYYKGSIALNAPRMIGIVGTRRITDYGKSIVEKLMADLASYDVVTVSGLAFGVDVAVHKHSIKNQIPTIGVMANGLDEVYPRAHSQLAKEMLLQGGLLTETMSETKLLKEFFPRRNRLVAGMVDALIVVESAAKGGSLITANIAQSFSRDVFAFPGRVGDDRSAGCNALIKSQKAAMIESAADLAWNMGWPAPENQSKLNERTSQLSGIEKRIYSYLKSQTEQRAHIDALCDALLLSQSELSLLLLTMEFSGFVKNLPGNSYKAV